MPRVVEIVDIAAGPIAVARAKVRLADLSRELMPLFDRVYDEVRKGSIRQSGQNVVVYRGDPERLDIEAGVQVAAPFEPSGAIVCSRTPGGRAARLVHLGAYAGLPAAHDSILLWAERDGHALTGVRWEIYGDWVEDTAKLQTDVYYQLG